MEWDLFKISGLTTVILALGINDIPQEPSSGMLAPKARDVCTYEELIEGYRNVITACHSRGIEVFGCTITPLGGYKTFNQKTEELRRKTNEWILNSGEFDRTFDFAAWISEVENPAYLPGEYDIGDHLHINERAGENIASKINLTI